MKDTLDEVTVHYFNTGRLYQPHGQRISWVEVAADSVVYFHDHSRMICGEIDVPKLQIVTARWIMRRYDLGEYRQSARADRMTALDGPLYVWRGSDDAALQL